MMVSTFLLSASILYNLTSAALLIFFAGDDNGKVQTAKQIGGDHRYENSDRHADDTGGFGNAGIGRPHDVSEKTFGKKFSETHNSSISVIPDNSIA